MAQSIGTTLFLAFGFVPFAPTGGPPRPPRENDAIVVRLEKILERLDALEQRLEFIEADLIDNRVITIDKAGVMRLPSGRPCHAWRDPKNSLPRRHRGRSSARGQPAGNVFH